MTPIERDDLILEAALEFGPECMYDISHGPLGNTLHISTRHRAEATRIRQQVPISWFGLYTIVLYPTYTLCEADIKKEEDICY
jgi:hypothetical protein